MKHLPMKALPHPISQPCPKCGESMDLDHPIVRGDESDTNRLIGECPECGELANVDLLAESDEDRESEYMDIEFDAKHYGL